MPLEAGLQLGVYEIQALLGVGGMSEVYRARDTRLNRDVAVKVLPDPFALDHERVMRFAREAQVLASLNHPNIAAIYGAHEANGRTALVLELVEGTTLVERIAQGRLPAEEPFRLPARSPASASRTSPRNHPRRFLMRRRARASPSDSTRLRRMDRVSR
jgi:serine/threonine protein kinase